MLQSTQKLRRPYNYIMSKEELVDMIIQNHAFNRNMARGTSAT